MITITVYITQDYKEHIDIQVPSTYTRDMITQAVNTVCPVWYYYDIQDSISY